MTPEACTNCDNKRVFYYRTVELIEDDKGTHNVYSWRCGRCDTIVEVRGLNSKKDEIVSKAIIALSLLSFVVS